jgi:hypothetical protein
MLLDNFVMMISITATAFSDGHHYSSSNSFFNIDANGFQIRISTVLISGQNANQNANPEAKA